MNVRPCHWVMLAATLALAGCHVSSDVHVFTSTIFEPMNIEVAEQITKKRLWYYEIPVYHRLKLKFRNNQDKSPFKMSEFPATTMEWWDLKADDNDKIVDHGKVEFTGVPIIMRMSLRKAPEYPKQLAALMPAPPAPVQEQPPEKPAAADAAPALPLYVQLAQDGSASVGKYDLTDERLTELMRAMVSEAPNRPVVIVAPATTPAQRVNQVVALCTQAGVQNVTVQSQAPEEPPEGTSEVTPEGTPEITPEVKPESAPATPVDPTPEADLLLE